MQVTKSCFGLEEETPFRKSLKELKDLRSQLHFAADYCQTAFLESQDKKVVVDNTKEYICRAMVTLVDHLGNVSANLDDTISSTNDFKEAELRIERFKTRFLSCEHYMNTLALSQLRWREFLPKHHRRYLSLPNIDCLEKSSQDLRVSGSTKNMEKNEIDTETVPLFLHTSSTQKPSLSKVVPVRDQVPSKSTDIKFHFQMGSTRLRRSRSLNRKTVSSLIQGSEILSMIRRAKIRSHKN